MTQISPDLLDRSGDAQHRDWLAMNASHAVLPPARPVALMVALTAAGTALIALANRLLRGLS